MLFFRYLIPEVHPGGLIQGQGPSRAGVGREGRDVHVVIWLLSSNLGFPCPRFVFNCFLP